MKLDAGELVDTGVDLTKVDLTRPIAQRAVAQKIIAAIERGGDTTTTPAAPESTGRDTTPLAGR